MERKILPLPCGVKIGGDSFVQIMTAEISGTKNNLYLEISVMNLHSRALNAIDFEVVFYNSILERLNTDIQKINQKDFNIANGEIGSTGKYYIKGEFSDARKVDITLLRGYFDDGNVLDLEYKNSEIIMLDNLEAKQKELLQDSAGTDAIALAQKNELSWRCICGYFNDKSSVICGNCERDKDEVLQKYSSLEGLLSVEAEEIAHIGHSEGLGEEPKEGEEMEQENKKKKVKKIKVKKEKKEKVKKEKKESSKNNLFETISSKLSVLDKRSKILFLGSFVLLIISILVWIIF